jgi:hypothetical protein
MNPTDATLAALQTARESAMACLDAEHQVRSRVLRDDWPEDRPDDDWLAGQGITPVPRLLRRQLAEWIVRLDEALLAADKAVEPVEHLLCRDGGCVGGGMFATCAHRLAVKLARRTAQRVNAGIVRAWSEDPGPGVALDDLAHLGLEPVVPVHEVFKCPMTMEHLGEHWREATVATLREVLADLPDHGPPHLAERIRLEYNLAARAVGASATATPRVSLDRDTQTVILDGKPYKVENARAFAVYQVIVENRPHPIIAALIGERVRGSRGKRAVKANINRLPAPLRDTVQSGTAGYWFDADGKTQRRAKPQPRGKPRPRRGQKKGTPRPHRAPT